MATLDYRRSAHCSPYGREIALSGEIDDHSRRGQRSEKKNEIVRCSLLALKMEKGAMRPGHFHQESEARH